MYVFAVIADWGYAVQKCIDEQWEWLIPPTGSPAINKGLDVWNTLKVVCQGPNLRFYANGELLQEITDPSPLSQGAVGLFALDEITEQEVPIVSFDNAFLVPIENSF